MKRLINMIVCICLATIIVSCGPASDLPSNRFLNEGAMGSDIQLKSNVQKVAEQMLQIADDYLDLKCTISDAQDRCKELKNRMSTMSDVSSDEYRYQNPNHMVIGYVEQISYAIEKSKEDTSIEKYRDMLAYYLGQPQRRDSYAAEKDFWDYTADEKEKKLFEEIGINSTDFSDCSIYSSSNYTNITIRYNTLNAVSIDDFVTYAGKICDAISGISDISEYIIKLYLDYYEYDNEIACIEIDNPNGTLRIRAFSYADEQYIEFKSMEDIRSALND